MNILIPSIRSNLLFHNEIHDCLHLGRVRHPYYFGIGFGWPRTQVSHWLVFKSTSIFQQRIPITKLSGELIIFIQNFIITSEFQEKIVRSTKKSFIHSILMNYIRLMFNRAKQNEFLSVYTLFVQVASKKINSVECCMYKRIEPVCSTFQLKNDIIVCDFSTRDCHSPFFGVSFGRT